MRLKSGREPRLAAVEEADAVPSLVDPVVGPGGSDHRDRVTEELRVPDRGEVVAVAGLTDQRPDDAVEEGPGVR